MWSVIPIPITHTGATVAVVQETRVRQENSGAACGIEPCMAVARNLWGGGGGGGEATGAPVTPVSRGVWLPQKILKFRSPEMPFPEAISSSYLIQVMIF